MNRVFIHGFVFIFPIVILCGCSQATTPSNQTNHTVVNSSVGLYPVSEQIKDLSHPDGTIASLTPYTIKGQNPYIKLYKMFYWSAGKKVEAFVSVPTDSGKYPLLIGCHGGYMVPLKLSHVQLPQITKPSDLAQDTALYVEVDPMYRGYEESEGSVQNVSQNTLDTENAIKAAETFKDVIPSELYVAGTSMGGEVALMLAERPDVKAVVAVSPWVGWALNMEWAAKNNKDVRAGALWNEALAAYGTADPNSSNYKRESPDISKIKAPVLILQGTGDQNVVWQVVQTFVNNMKAAGKTVSFQLYPGGNHGLTDKYAKDRFYETNTWFVEYGLDLL